MAFKHSSKHQGLSSFCQNGSCLKTKFALLSFYEIQYSKWTETFILILEYLQLMSQVILSSSINYDHPAFDSFVFDIIVYFFKIINPSYLLTYEKSNAVTITVLAILFSITLLKILLFGYLIWVCLWKNTPSRLLLFLWRWTFKLQTRVIYFLFTTFWVKVIIEEDFGIFETSKSFLTVISSLMLAIEFIFSFLLETQFSYALPTKDLLSSKSNTLQILTLLQKLIIQVVMMILSKAGPLTSAWVASVIGLLLSALREYEFTTKLPLYKFKALVIQRALLCLVISLNLAYFLHTILKAASYEGANINLLIFIWIIVSLLSIKGAHEHLKRLNLSLLVCGTEDRKSSPEMLLHKVWATEELRLQQFLPNQKSQKYHWTYLTVTHQRMRIQDIFGASSEFELTQAMPEDLLNRVFLLYLENLLKTKFSDNFLISLHTAFLSWKSSEPFAKTIKIATQLKQNKWSPNYLSQALLLYEIEKSMRTNDNDNQLDLFTYVQSKVLVEDIKRKMVKQINLYLKVCQNILGDTSNIEEIYSSGQAISQIKGQVQKQINNASRSHPQHFISPFLCYAKYYSIVNHSSIEFDQYCQIYVQRYFKLEKSFKEPNLIEENLYQDSNAFLLLSTQKSEFGKILFHNTSLVALFGGNNLKGFIGSRISRVFPPFLRSYYDKLAKESLSVKNKQLINKTHRTYLYHKEKYLMEADFCLKYHHYITQGLCLTMIIRPVPSSSEEYLIMKEDGSIQGASKELSKMLKFNDVEESGSDIYAKMLSKELDDINRAFNIVLKKDNKTNIATTRSGFHIPKGVHDFPAPSEMSYEKALEIYSTYTTENPKIQLYPYEKGQSSLKKNEAQAFYTNVRVIQFGNIDVKVVLLRPTTLQENSFQNSESPKNHFESENMSSEAEDEYAQKVTIFNSQSLPTSIIPTTQPDLPLLSPVSETRRFLGETTVRITYAETQKSPQTKNTEMLKTQSLSDGEEEERPNRNNAKQMIYKYKASQQSSQKSGEKASDKAFKAAILIKSYPKSFIILCIVFYGAVLVTFATQIIMKFVSDSTMKDLQIKKNLMKLSQERSYMAALAHALTLGGVLNIKGAITAGGSVVDLNTTLYNLQGRMKYMKAANDEMLEYVYSLDREFQDLLFVQDVGINGTYLDSDDGSYKKVNTFQATEEFASAVTAVNALSNPVSVEGYNIFNYVTINIANDFQYKNKQITNIFISSVQKQKQSYQIVINVCLFLTPVLLAALAILLAFIIWNQHQIEKRNLKAFIKINPKTVKEISDQLAKFKKNLINDESFERKWLSGMNEEFEVGPEFEQNSSYSKKHNTQVIIYKDFRKRYINYILRVTLYMGILIGITIWDFISTKISIRVIYNRQDQLQFANYLCNRATTAYTSFEMLYVENNTMLVEHEVTLQSLYHTTQEIQEIQTQIPSSLVEIDGSYNPDVQKILFDNDPDCKNFESDFLLHCNYLVGLGQPVNLMVVIAAYQSVLTTQYQNYLTANKTTEASLLAVAYENVYVLLSDWMVLSYEALMISDIMNETLDQKIDENKNARAVIITVFSISIMVISIVIWIDILRVIRDVHNDFKKVLQIFPPNLVLSSYLLKNFLQQTANQVLFG